MSAAEKQIDHRMYILSGPTCIGLEKLTIEESKEESCNNGHYVRGAESESSRASPDRTPLVINTTLRPFESSNSTPHVTMATDIRPYNSTPHVTIGSLLGI